MCKNSHKIQCTRTMYLNKKEKKRYKASSLHPSTKKKKKKTLPLTKMSNSPPKNDYFHIQKPTPPFCHEWQRIRVSSRHLIRRASISIIIIQSIIIITIIIILMLRIRSHGRRWWRSSLRSKSAHGHLLSSYAANVNIHLIQLCGKCIEASMHALKLRHDVSQWHIAWGRKGSGCGSIRTRWDRLGVRCRILLSRPKLCLTTFYSSGVYGTHEGEGVGCRKRDRKMA